MATSNSTDFNLTRNEIITEALENVGAISEGQVASAYKITSAARTLNLFVKNLQNKGINLWSLEWVVKSFSAHDVVSNNAVNYKCQLPHTSAAADEPGVGANWNLYWIITTDTAGGAWALSTAYTTPQAFDVASDTIGIDQAFYRDTSGSDHPVEITSFAKYLEISDKDKTGTMKEIALQQGLTPRIHVYQPANTLTDVLHYMRIRKLEDFDGSSDNPDSPQRALNLLVAGLTFKLMPKYSVKALEKNTIENNYLEALRDFKGINIDNDENDFTESSY